MEPAAPPPHVLIVDDDETRRYIVRKALEKAGMRTTEARSGEDALREVQALPDLVVLDIKLPDLSGFEVCRRIKSDARTRGVPVLYTSAFMPEGELRDQGLAHGAEGFIRQPVDPPDLVAQVKVLVRLRRTELALARRLQHERRAWDSGVVAMFTWTIDGRVRDANETFLGMLGFTREDLEAGRIDWRKLTPPEWDALDARLITQLLDRGYTDELEKQFFRKDGSRADIALSTALFEGSRTEGVGLVQDITARKEAERRAKHLLATSTGLAKVTTSEDVAKTLVHEALMSVPAVGGIVFFARPDGSLKKGAYFGHELQRMDALDEVPAGSRSLVGQTFRSGTPAWVLSRAELARRSPLYADKVGPDVNAWAFLPMVSPGQTVGVLLLSFASAQPLTAETRTFLETVAGLGAQAFSRSRLFEEEQRARGEAQQLAELERVLVGVVSHDLQNPVQAVRLAAQTLLRAKQVTRESVERHAARIDRSAERMQEIIRQLLDFTQARLAGGISLVPAEIDLGDVVRDVCDELTVTAPGRVQLDPQGDLHGRWDARRLQQVVSNLGGNALKYGAAELPVWIRVDGTAKDQVTIRVENGGAPIPPQLLASMFEPFRRGMSGESGLGLGLFIVREIVRAHGGHVAVSSDSSLTAFSVTLPREAPAARIGPTAG